MFTVRFQSWALARSQGKGASGSGFKPLTTVSSLWSKGSGRQGGRKWLAQSSGLNYLGRKIITFHGLGTEATARGVEVGEGQAGLGRWWPHLRFSTPPGATKL